MADHQFEKKLSQQMADFKLKPSAEVWQQVERQIKEDKRRRRWFFILPLAALLLGGMLYAVWPSESTLKNESTTVSENQPTTVSEKEPTTVSKNVPAATTKTNTTDSPLTITKSSNEVPEQKNAAVTTTQPKEQELKAVNGSADVNKVSAKTVVQKTVSTEKNVQPKAKQETGNVTQPKTEEKIIASTTIKATEQISVQSKPPADTSVTTEVITIKTEQQTDTLFATTTTVISKKDSADVTYAVTSVDSAATKLPVPQISIPKRKLQWGLHVNAGISDIRENLFPGEMLKAETVSYLAGGSNMPPFANISRAIRYEYTVKSSVQFGAGITLRKPFKKKHAFVTGLQYQYSSYNVAQLQKIDTFVYTSNFFNTISANEKRVGFRIHAISVPLEVEWQLARFKKGALLLNAGLYQYFAIASTQTDTLYSFRYTATADRSSGGVGFTTNETKATVWQPMFYLSPAYEWKAKTLSSQLGLYVNYGLRPAYKASEKDYWLQAGLRYRIYFNR